MYHLTFLPCFLALQNLVWYLLCLGALSVHRGSKVQIGTSQVWLFGQGRGICRGPMLSVSVFGKLKAFPESKGVAVERRSWRQAKVLLLNC